MISVGIDEWKRVEAILSSCKLVSPATSGGRVPVKSVSRSRSARRCFQCSTMSKIGPSKRVNGATNSCRAESCVKVEGTVPVMRLSPMLSDIKLVREPM